MNPETLLELARRAESRCQPFVEVEIEATSAWRNRGQARVFGITGHVVREVFKPRESPKLLVCLSVRDVLVRLQGNAA